MTILSDPQRTTIAAYGVADGAREIALPAVIIVDAQRRIRYRYVGKGVTDRPTAAEVLAQVRKRKVAP